MTSPTSTVLAYCHPSSVDAGFHASVTGFLLWDQRRGGGKVTTHGGVVAVACGPRIASGRNELVRAFLSHDRSPEWLWMVDTDMVFEPNTLDRLLKVTGEVTPIVGALCFGGGRSGRVFPTMYRMVDGEPEVVEEWDEGSVVDVDATGAACVLIHRSVLTAMGRRVGGVYPWFAEEVLNDHELGEDMTFCLRARSMGFRVVVDTSVEIGHMKPMVMDGETWRGYRADREVLGDQGITRRYLERRRLLPTSGVDHPSTPVPGFTFADQAKREIRQ